MRLCEDPRLTYLNKLGYNVRSAGASAKLAFDALESLEPALLGAGRLLRL